MDLNELLHAHQVEVLKANASEDSEIREGHFDMIARYADEIRALRKVAPEDRSARVASSRDTVIYGSYAGNPSPAPGPPALPTGRRDAEARAASENPDRGYADG